LEAPLKSRLENLSDGIFAVAMTLLVLDIKLPPNLPLELTSAQLFAAVFDLWPKIGAFIVSFFFLAKTWDVQRLVVHSLERVDYTFSIENLLLLLFACGLPFLTSIMRCGAMQLTTFGCSAKISIPLLLNGSGEITDL
jgi:TMEM175 potassium channel family protein